MQEPSAVGVDLLFRGFALFKSGQYDDAAAYFRLLTLHAPLEGRFWVTLAHTLRKTGELQEAIEAYKTALILGLSKDPEILLSLAEVLQDTGAFEEARIVLEEAYQVAEPAFKSHIEFIKNAWYSTNQVGV